MKNHAKVKFLHLAFLKNLFRALKRVAPYKSSGPGSAHHFELIFFLFQTKVLC